LASMLSDELEKKQILEHDLELNQIEDQLNIFAKGIPFIHLDRPCTPGDGILLLKSSTFEELKELHSESALAGRFSKFVPASGAATRMFKDISRFLRKYPDIHTFSELNEQAKKGDSTLQYVARFLRRIDQFAFYRLLEKSLSSVSQSLDDLLKNGSIRPILEHLLENDFLGYQNKPKGLIPFHIRDGELLTPFAEHLFEAFSYMKSESGQCRIHFTIAPKHLDEVKEHIVALTKKYSKLGVSFRIDFSVQKSSTDTVAVQPDNSLYHSPEGKLLFRPAGHGALLQNLNEMQGDIVYIKNIDNIVPEDKREDTYTYKVLLGGLLVKLQNKVFEILSKIDTDEISLALTEEIKSWSIKNLNSSFPKKWNEYNLDDRKKHIHKLLNRPIRVCGMVKNLGQPGGGPFWIREKDGTTSPQIIESSQIDHNNPEQEIITSSATHFNPVDLVCGVTDYRGKPFNLNDYVDNNTGFISEKSYKGQSIKALELPGLWNGAMAGWSTVFVDVPITTFSPVKSVNDLLSEDHS